MNTYMGIGWRSNESHNHFLGGVRLTPAGTPWTLGLQLDGHKAHGFVTRGFGKTVVGLYAIEMKSLGFMLAVKF
jgi:hypothetical protein